MAKSVLERFRLYSSTRYTYFHVVVFALTFITYVIVHANRKSFSSVKVLISEEWTPSTKHFSVGTSLNGHSAPRKPMQPDSLWNDQSFFQHRHGRDLKTFLGGLDTAFMIAYAVGLYAGGPIGDHLNLRYCLFGSMIATSVLITLFIGLPEWISFFSMPYYVTIWAANGLIQGVIWPCILAVMGHWFDNSHRGLIFGVWSAHASVGNIFGSVCVAQFIDYGYEIAVIVPAILMVGIAVIIFAGLVTSPKDVGLHQTTTTDTPHEACQRHVRGSSSLIIHHEHEIEASQPEPSAQDAETRPALNTSAEQTKKAESVSIFQVFMIPGVIMYSIAFACLKLVHYAFFFWLPYYLNRNFHWAQDVADNLSTWYDFGGILGAIFGGVISDHVFGRSAVLEGMLFLALPSLIVYRELPGDLTINAIGLTVCGFFIGGVANLLSGAIPADLGRNPKLKGNKAAFATVCGIIDGTGSVGAAIGQILVPLIEDAFGWDAVFGMLIFCTFLSCLGILPIFIREFRGFFKASPTRKLHPICSRCCCLSSSQPPIESIIAFPISNRDANVPADFSGIELLPARITAAPLI